MIPSQMLINRKLPIFNGQICQLWIFYISLQHNNFFFLKWGQHLIIPQQLL
jgi:hypothetical protein